MTVGELVAYIDLEDSKFNRGIDAAERKFAGAGDRISKIGTKIGGVLTMAAKGGVLALGAGLAAGAVAGFKFNSSIEQTTIAMGTMLGSTKAATSLISEVTKMASATPFEFPELADATKRLVAYGVAAKDAVPLMTRLGDISSALQIPIGELADIYGKMKVSGRITMEDMNQLAGRGIPIYSALAGVLGVSSDKIRGLVEAGEVGFPEIEKAFEKITDKGSMFGGMMDKQSRSFAGLWSTIKDSLTQVFATAVKPLFTWLSETGMPALIELMPKIQKTVSHAIRAIGKWFDAHKEQIVGFFRTIGKIAKFAAENIDLVAVAVGGLLAMKLTAGIAGMFGGISAGAAGAAGSVAGFSGVLRLVPWAGALAGAIALGDYLGGKLQNIIDGFDRKMGMTNKEIERQHKLMASRFGGKAAAEWDKTKNAADRTTSSFKKTGSELTKIGKMHPKPKVDIDKDAAVTKAKKAHTEIENVLKKAIGIGVNVKFNFGSGLGTGLGSEIGSAVNGLRATSWAKGHLGDSYQVGATGPSTWDCSGFVMGAYRASGRPNFPTYTGNQWVLGSQIPKSAIRPGDQIFMKTGNAQYTDQFGWGHTGIYIGGGQMIHAAGRASGVITSPVGAGYPWAARRQLAKGGLVKAQPGGVPALLGEAGKDELVISNLRRGTVGGSGDVSLEFVFTGDNYFRDDDEIEGSIDYITQEVTRRLAPAIRATQRMVTG